MAEGSIGQSLKCKLGGVLLKDANPNTLIHSEIGSNDKFDEGQLKELPAWSFFNGIGQS